jgi:hypothetical protein
MGQIPSDRLKTADRFQLAWAIAWPLVLFNLAVWWPSDHLGLSQGLLDSVDLVSAVLFTFLVLPWSVRRALRIDFPRFHLLLCRESGEQIRAIRYRESLSVAWLLNWRTRALLVILRLVVWGTVWMAQGVFPDNPFKHTVNPGVRGLSWQLLENAAALLLLVFWILDAALNKAYSGFKLRTAQPMPVNRSI